MSFVNVERGTEGRGGVGRGGRGKGGKDEGRSFITVVEKRTFARRQIYCKSSLLVEDEQGFITKQLWKSCND